MLSACWTALVLCDRVHRLLDIAAVSGEIYFECYLCAHDTRTEQRHSITVKIRVGEFSAAMLISRKQNAIVSNVGRCARHVCSLALALDALSMRCVKHLE